MAYYKDFNFVGRADTNLLAVASVGRQFANMLGLHGFTATSSDSDFSVEITAYKGMSKRITLGWTASAGSATPNYKNILITIYRQDKVTVDQTLTAIGVLLTELRDGQNVAWLQVRLYFLKDEGIFVHLPTYPYSTGLLWRKMYTLDDVESYWTVGLYNAMSIIPANNTYPAVGEGDELFYWRGGYGTSTYDNFPALRIKSEYGSMLAPMFYSISEPFSNRGFDHYTKNTFYLMTTKTLDWITFFSMQGRVFMAIYLSNQGVVIPLALELENR